MAVALSRRSLLRASALLALSGCVRAPAPSTPQLTSAAATALTLPSHVPVQVPPPDLPGTASGVRAAYFKFPTNLVRSVSQPPGNGGDVNTLFYVVTGTPPTPLEQNLAWQQLNSQINATVKAVFVSYADYPARLATILAGNDLPDIFCISVLGSLIQGMPEFMERSCADLTPYIAGDAIKEYPNLAGLPAAAWPTAIFNNKIFCIPQVDSNTGPDLLGNGKQLAQVGATFDTFKNVDDFTRIARLLTTGDHWAIGSNILTWLMEVFRVPNDWRESSGKLTKDIETDEYKEAVAYLRSLWAAGVIWPDTPAATVNTLAQGFYAGKYTFWPNLFLSYTGAWDGTFGQDPAFDMRALIPFGHDGGKGVQFLGNGSIGLTVLKKASPERVKEWLGILNFLAAPFGSRENLLIQYGVEGTDHTINDKGNPVLTPKGQMDIVPWAGIVRRPPVLFDPNSEEAARRGHADEAAAIAIGIKSPTVGLYSNTYAAKGSSLNRAFTDGINQIVYGREPVSSLDDLVQTWRTSGGDQIRSEYEQALQRQRSS